MISGPVAVSCPPGEVCITCSDQGIAMTVTSLRADGLAFCADGAGRTEEVDLALVTPIAVGDSVLVHARVALARLGEQVA